VRWGFGLEVLGHATDNPMAPRPAGLGHSRAAQALVIATPPPGPCPGRVTRWADTIIYELHVRGFTATHPGVPENLRRVPMPDWLIQPRCSI